MSIIIGGSGSVGSTLLATVLNRHADVFCGPELSLFNKELVFTDWRTASTRIRLQPQKFVTHGWGPYSGSSLYHDDYCWDRDELDQLLSESGSIEEFSCQFFKRPLSMKGKSVWVEKTPSNSFCFPEFLHAFENSRVVHMTRNPYDAVASLVNRGFTPIYAAGIWIYNCAMALRSRNSDRYHELSYEDLTTGTEDAIEVLCRSIGIKFDADLLARAGNSEKGRELESWTFSPGDSIQPRSVGGFERLATPVRDEVRTALTVFRVSGRHQHCYSMPAKSCEEVCALLEYDFEPLVNKRFLPKFGVETVKDAVRRTARGYKTGLGNYPARLNW